MRSEDDRTENKGIQILTDIWVNSFLGLKAALYVIAILFIGVGIYAVCRKAWLPGVILITANVLLVFVLRKLDKRAAGTFDREFDEMVRRNRGE